MCQWKKNEKKKPNSFNLADKRKNAKHSSKSEGMSLELHVGRASLTRQRANRVNSIIYTST